jgi:voltage-gated sodium channel
VFFVSFILVAAFIVINVLIGIVLNSLEEARELERRESLAPGEAVPVLERIQILRSALDELEQELQEQPHREREASGASLEPRR